MNSPSLCARSITTKFTARATRGRGGLDAKWIPSRWPPNFGHPLMPGRRLWRRPATRLKEVPMAWRENKPRVNDHGVATVNKVENSLLDRQRPRPHEVGGCGSLGRDGTATHSRNRAIHYTAHTFDRIAI